ncbi:hypothetical protein [Nonomuraea wenchangensis]|uniref:hypothetical protein n=1 Tax=Nonomuraea wenchangensis TaxID=568860 RepID=UPI00332A4FF7
MSEYIYTDPYGSRLRIYPSEGSKTDVTMQVLDRTDINAPAADLPEIVAGMYRGAGQELPIILPRREPEEGMTQDGMVQAWYPSGPVVEPAEALNIASWYATAAQEAITEALSRPDPAQVEALAGVIRDLAERDVLITDDDGKTVARAILAAGYVRAEDQS